MKLFDLFPPIHEEGYLAGPAVTGIHSGNLGDIIYSILTIRKLEINHLVLNLCTDPFFSGRTLTKASALSMAAFLVSSKIVDKVSIVNTQIPFEYTDPQAWGLNHILDRFRSKGYDQRLHLAFQHSLSFGIQVDLNEPWLPKIKGQRKFPQPYIAVGITSRYRRFDNGYYEQLFREISPDQLVFIGTPFDQMERCSIQGHLFQSENFSEIAQVLCAAELFIGNPSFTYALAEALKVPRIVEVPDNNNVYPLGSGGQLLHQCRRESVRRQLISSLKIQPPQSIEMELLSLMETAEQMRQSPPAPEKQNLRKRMKRFFR
jgi:hypothetical protein